MEFEGVRVLVLEGYARQSLPLLRAFKELGCHTSALCSSRLDVAYVSRFTDKRIIGVCDRDKVSETTEQVRELLKTGEFDVVVPTVDFSAALLSYNKEEFRRYARIASNDPDTYEMAGDKFKTMKVCMENNIPCPVTLDCISDVREVLNSGIQFPIVIKPRVGYGAIGFKIINTDEELVALFNDGERNPQEYVFQEYIPQTGFQYACTVFLGNDNKVKTAVVYCKNRWFPINGGAGTLNTTVMCPDIIENSVNLLKKINWRGAAEIDFIQNERDNTAKVMEINPRVSGSVKIVFEAGVNLARQMLELVYDTPVTEYKRYRIGQRLRCSQIDLLWFIKSNNRFKANPSWFSSKNTTDATFTWDDPLPWFAFSIGGLCRVNREMEKRSR